MRETRERVSITFNWQRFWVRAEVPYDRRPLGAMIEPIVGAGFRLEHLVEPRPIPEFERGDPDEYAKLMQQPGFITFRALGRDLRHRERRREVSS